MATSSFFNQIKIEDSKDCEALVYAMESARQQSSTCNNVPKPTWATQEDIKNMTFSLNPQ